MNFSEYTDFKKIESWAWWHTFIGLALGGVDAETRRKLNAVQSSSNKCMHTHKSKSLLPVPTEEPQF